METSRHDAFKKELLDLMSKHDVYIEKLEFDDTDDHLVDVQYWFHSDRIYRDGFYQDGIYLEIGELYDQRPKKAVGENDAKPATD